MDFTDFQSNNINYFNLNGSQHYNPVLAAVITSRQNGERNIFTNHPNPIDPEIRAEELFQKVNPQIVLLDGFYPEAVVEICHFANRLNIPVGLDCGSWKSLYEQIIPHTQIAICSADFISPGYETIDDVIDFLNEHGVQKSANSRGGENLIFSDGVRRGEVPVEKLKIKDSLGAGDFLHGAFCFYYLQMNCDFENALKMAVKFATYTCMYEGTRRWKIGRAHV